MAPHPCRYKYTFNKGKLKVSGLEGLGLGLVFDVCGQWPLIPVGVRLLLQQGQTQGECVLDGLGLGLVLDVCGQWPLILVGVRLRLQQGQLKVSVC